MCHRWHSGASSASFSTSFPCLGELPVGFKSDKPDLHALNEDGMLVCNPRDREAAHRGQVESIATDNRMAVIFKKCSALMRRARTRSR